jgi:hypothetical protein
LKKKNSAANRFQAFHKENLMQQRRPLPGWSGRLQNLPAFQVSPEIKPGARVKVLQRYIRPNNRG